MLDSDRGPIEDVASEPTGELERDELAEGEDSEEERRPRPIPKQGKLSLMAEFATFLKQEGKWWLTPIVVILLLLGALLIYAEGSVIVPFIYTLF